MAYVDFGNAVGMQAGFVQVMCQHLYRIIIYSYEIEAFFDESISVRGDVDYSMRMVLILSLSGCFYLYELEI